MLLIDIKLFTVHIIGNIIVKINALNLLLSLPLDFDNLHTSDENKEIKL